MHTSASARAQLNAEDTARKSQPSVPKCTILLTHYTVSLNILITYQTPLGTEHWEPNTPDAELDHVRQVVNCTAETSATLMALERAREDLEELKLKHRSKPNTKTSENSALKQKTELLMRTHKVTTALEMLQAEAATQKSDQNQKAEVESEEVHALNQKTETVMEKLKTGTAPEMARAERVRQKWTDLCEKSIQRSRAIEKRYQMAEDLDEGMEKWFTKVCQLMSD